MVIYGATYHSYAQGLKYGVPDKVKCAVIDDIPANVISITGASDTVDAWDGAGLTSPLFSRMQNRSLIDAAVHANKKTIYHDIESKYGSPTLLKWAEYEITNEKRRNSVTLSLENLYKRMHNLQFSDDLKLTQTFDNLYYQETDGTLYRITSITVENGIGHMQRTIVNENGNFISNANPKTMKVSSIYDLDQLLGGA